MNESHPTLRRPPKYLKERIKLAKIESEINAMGQLCNGKRKAFPRLGSKRSLAGGTSGH